MESMNGYDSWTGDYDDETWGSPNSNALMTDTDRQLLALIDTVEESFREDPPDMNCTVCGDPIAFNNVRPEWIAEEGGFAPANYCRYCQVDIKIVEGHPLMTFRYELSLGMVIYSRMGLMCWLGPQTAKPIEHVIRDIPLHDMAIWSIINPALVNKPRGCIHQ
jgi:hypothetical protein